MSWRISFRNKAGLRRCSCTTELLFLIFLLFTVPAAAGAAETRQHGAHVHGIGQLDIALDGSELMLRLKSPAANIVGFEHAPETEEQTHAVHEALELLEAGDKMFVLTPGAQCSFHEAHVESGMEEEHHEEHDAHHQENEEVHAEHEHEHADGQVHSEFMVTYHFECVEPDRLKSIDVQLFSHFQGFEDLEVQLLTRTIQTAAELTAKKTQISF